MSKYFMLVLLLALCLPLASAQREDSPPYAERGQYKVGTMDFVLEDAERPLNVTIWYPVDPENRESQKTIHRVFFTLTIEGQAIKNAEPAQALQAFPLVVLSHGSGGSRLLHRNLTELLASYGFIVMAADHPGNNFVDALQGIDNFVLNYALRPTDVLRQIDYAEALNQAGQFAGLIDMANVAVVGHSFGGTTVLQTAGARLNFDNLRDWCADPQGRENICFLLDDEAEIAQLRGYETVPSGSWAALSDSRIKALVAYAPWNAIGLDLSAINVPSLIVVGAADATAPHDRDAATIFNQLPSPTYFATFQLGGHYLYIDECPANLRLGADLYGACSDPVWDMDRAHDIINQLTVPFLLHYLQGDESAAAALQADSVHFRGVTYLSK